MTRRGVGLVLALAGGAGVATGVLAPLVPAPHERPPAVEASARPPSETFDPVFEPCAHCHQIGPGARTMTGPSLQGLIGRRAGVAPGYPFSAAMRESGLVWDAATLSRFIENPQGLVPGTRMIFAGISDSAQRGTIIGYISKVNGASH